MDRENWEPEILNLSEYNEVKYRVTTPMGLDLRALESQGRQVIFLVEELITKFGFDESSIEKIRTRSGKGRLNGQVVDVIFESQVIAIIERYCSEKSREVRTQAVGAPTLLANSQPIIPKQLSESLHAECTYDIWDSKGIGGIRTTSGELSFLSGVQQVNPESPEDLFILSQIRGLEFVRITPKLPDLDEVFKHGFSFVKLVELFIARKKYVSKQAKVLVRRFSDERRYLSVPDNIKNAYLDQGIILVDADYDGDVEIDPQKSVAAGEFLENTYQLFRSYLLKMIARDEITFPNLIEEWKKVQSQVGENSIDLDRIKREIIEGVARKIIYETGASNPEIVIQAQQYLSAVAIEFMEAQESIGLKVAMPFRLFGFGGEGRHLPETVFPLLSSWLTEYIDDLLNMLEGRKGIVKMENIINPVFAEYNLIEAYILSALKHYEWIDDEGRIVEGKEDQFQSIQDDFAGLKRKIAEYKDRIANLNAEIRPDDPEKKQKQKLRGKKVRKYFRERQDIKDRQ